MGVFTSIEEDRLVGGNRRADFMSGLGIGGSALLHPARARPILSVRGRSVCLQTFERLWAQNMMNHSRFDGIGRGFNELMGVYVVA